MVDWIVILSGATGTGSGTVQIRVMNAPPTQLPRTGTVIIGGRTFTAHQQQD